MAKGKAILRKRPPPLSHAGHLTLGVAAWTLWVQTVELDVALGYSSAQIVILCQRYLATAQSMLEDFIRSDKRLTKSPSSQWGILCFFHKMMQEFVPRELPLQVVLTTNSWYIPLTQVREQPLCLDSDQGNHFSASSVCISWIRSSVLAFGNIWLISISHTICCSIQQVTGPELCLGITLLTTDLFSDANWDKMKTCMSKKLQEWVDNCSDFLFWRGHSYQPASP